MTKIRENQTKSCFYIPQPVSPFPMFLAWYNSMTNIMISKKIPLGEGYKVRIRYRDMALGWSEWSDTKSI